MACAGRILVWWDRDFDSGGRPIRADVRLAGREVWKKACRQAMASLADDTPAAELMETAVAQVSRYLDRIRAPFASRKHGLVMFAFSRALRRYRAKSARLELVGASTDFADLTITEGWLLQANARLDFDNFVRRLSGRNAEVLMLRAAGYEWKEIAEAFDTTVSAIRNSFWREIRERRSVQMPRAPIADLPVFDSATCPVPVTRSDRNGAVRKAQAEPRMSVFPPTQIRTLCDSRAKDKRS